MNLKTMTRALPRGATAALATLAVAACTPDSDARSTSVGATASGDVARIESTLGAPLPANAVRYAVAPTGNVARYRVREQLMGRDLPNDAVGETREVSGALAFDDKGALVASGSRLTVRTGTFKSDSDRRDGYVRNRLLQSEQHPTVELAPTSAKGLPAGFVTAGNTAGPVTFDLVGDLTIRGVTRPTTWKVTARRTGDGVTGTATTKFTFADFTITPPKVPIVLSVADTIGLEYDFTLNRDRATP